MTNESVNATNVNFLKGKTLKPVKGEKPNQLSPSSLWATENSCNISNNTDSFEKKDVGDKADNNPKTILSDVAKKYQNNVNFICNRFTADGFYFKYFDEDHPNLTTVTTSVCKNGETVTTITKTDSEGNKLYEKQGKTEIYFDVNGNKLRESNGKEYIYYDRNGNVSYKYDSSSLKFEFYDKNGEVLYDMMNDKLEPIILPEVPNCKVAFDEKSGGFLGLTDEKGNMYEYDYEYDAEEDPDLYEEDVPVHIQVRVLDDNEEFDKVCFDSTNGHVSYATNGCPDDDGKEHEMTIYANGRVVHNTYADDFHSINTKTIVDDSHIKDIEE